MATKMFSLKRALLYAFLLAVLLEPISGRKGYSGSHSSHSSYGGGHHSGGLSGGHSSGSHSYPSSGGSHGGSHGYPSSGGLSGSGSKPSYPSSGGLSGGSHSYPSSGGLSGGSHSYPSSGGLSGTGSKPSYPTSGGLSGTGSKPSYPSSGGMSGGSHSYPTSGGMSGSGTHNKYPHSSGTYPTSSGSHNYPSSNSGLSGSGSSNRYPQKPVVHHTTTHTVHHHYHYSPPQQIPYTPVRGGATVYYPVYHQTPPSYVYTYKNSDSKYGTLLAGLALFNLGALAGNAYAHSGNSGSRTHYTPQPGEVCKFAMKKENGDYEETKIDCQIISSFIYQDLAQTRPAGTNTTTSVVTVTNTTVTNTSNMMPQGAMTPPPAAGNVLYTMLPNGTLVPVNMTGVPMPPMPLNVTQNVPQQLAANGVLTSSVVTTTTTNTTLVNALDVKGKPVTVTPGMECFVIRNSPTHNMRKHVPCGLLQTYADKSIQRNAAARNGPMFTVVAAILAFCLVY